MGFWIFLLVFSRGLFYLTVVCFFRTLIYCVLCLYFLVNDFVMGLFMVYCGYLVNVFIAGFLLYFVIRYFSRRVFSLFVLTGHDFIMRARCFIAF